MKVKICGITNIKDALIAADLGADAVGFIFVKSSPRFISPDIARQIIDKLPPSAVPIGVFADAPKYFVDDTIEQTGIRCIQFHGNELPEDLLGFQVPVLKAFHVGEDFDVNVLSKYAVSAYLLDTYMYGKLGGTGKTFDWNFALSAKVYGRIILAGGLTPDNIIVAIQKVQPYAVDVSSGVESMPGKKDHVKLQQLFHAIHNYEQELNIKGDKKR